MNVRNVNERGLGDRTGWALEHTRCDRWRVFDGGRERGTFATVGEALERILWLSRSSEVRCPFGGSFLARLSQWDSQR